MRRLWPTVVVLCVLAIVVAGRWSGANAQFGSLIHDRGQSVVPVYEGFYTNPDGSTVISFGFLNRNAKEEVDIPIGPNNKFDPPPADRGQPTNFIPRRQTGAFTVTLPKGEKTLTWTLISRGETFAIPVNLDQLWTITPLKDPTNGNTPPVIKFDSAGQSAQGLTGLKVSRKAAVATPLTLDAWATDDGVFQVTQVSEVSTDKVVNLTWSKYRGPGTVTFSSSTPAVDKATNKATTTATFSAPGEYVLRLLAADTGGSGSQCCWTNGYVNVSVSP